MGVWISVAIAFADLAVVKNAFSSLTVLDLGLILVVITYSRNILIISVSHFYLCANL